MLPSQGQCLQGCSHKTESTLVPFYPPEFVIPKFAPVTQFQKKPGLWKAIKPLLAAQETSIINWDI